MSNRRRRALLIASFVLTLPVWYMLSVGPASWLFQRGLIPPALVPHVVAYYVPLLWLHDNFDTCGQVLECYLDLWWKPG